MSGKGEKIDLKLLDCLLSAAPGSSPGSAPGSFKTAPGSWGGVVRFDALSRALDVDVMKLPGMIESLKDAGCVIESHPRHGIRLISTGIGCWSEYLEHKHSRGIGKRVLVYQETTSTQDVARQLIKGSAPGSSQPWPNGLVKSSDGKALNMTSGGDGWVVLADQQSAGRGRLGRSWLSVSGGSVLMSVVVAPAPGSSQPSSRGGLTSEGKASGGGGGMSIDRLMVGTCCAVAQAVEKVGDVRVDVRWPNDVMIDGKKLGGIIVETVDEVALVGIGINVGLLPEALRGKLPGVGVPDEVAGIATSLAACGVGVDRLSLIDVLLGQLEKELFATSDDQLAKAWRGRSMLLQQRVTVESDGKQLTGRVIDIDPRQGLLLEVENGPVVKLHAATTSLVLASP